MISKEYLDLLKNQFIRIGDDLLGLEVIHQEFGQGRIVGIAPRENEKSLIDIKFDGNVEINTFNDLSKDYFQIAKQTEEINQTIIIFLKNRNEAIEVFKKGQQQPIQELQILRQYVAQKFEMIREKLIYYKVIDFYRDLFNLMKNDQSSLKEMETNLVMIETIIQKIDLSRELDEGEIENLESMQLFNLLATSYHRCYGKNNDQWMLVKTCKYLRKARKPEQVVLITAEIGFENLPQIKSKINAALFTTRGAALKDTGNIYEAKKMANFALLSGESKFSHNLMGSVCYLEQQFTEGDVHFAKAVEMGSSPKDRIVEMHNLRRQLDPEGRAKLDAHLISINLKI